MINEEAAWMTWAIVLCIIVVSISYFTYSYNVERINQPKIDIAFDSCLSDCNSITNTVGEKNLDEAECTKQCYIFYRDALSCKQKSTQEVEE